MRRIRNSEGLSKAIRPSRQGASAVEFAMVALPFFFMMFAIMEIGLIFVTNAVLENAVQDSGRLVRTGQADTAGMTPAQFKTELCSRMSIFSGDCPGRAFVDVREIPQFRAPGTTDPMAGGTFDESNLDFQPGDPGSLMLVRVWYRQPLITPFLSQSLSRLNDNNAMLTITTAFRNEPYERP